MADIKHAVIRTDLMSGTNDFSRMRSFRYMADGETPTAIDNGNVVVLDGLMDGQREVYKAVTPTVSADINKVAIVATPELMYDAMHKQLEDFYNAEGKICRGYLPQIGTDIFSVTAEALEVAGTPAKGWAVELGATTKLKAVESPTGGSTQIGKIIDVETVGSRVYYVIGC